MSKTTATKQAINKPAAKGEKPARAPRVSKGKTPAAPAAPAAPASEVKQEQGDGITGFESHTDSTPAAAPVAPAPAPVVKTYAQRLSDALTARPQESKDLDIAVNDIARGAVALNLIAARPEWEAICDNLLTLAGVGTKGDARFVAVKVWVKIVKMLQAMQAGIASYADPYTRTLCYNITSLQADGLTNKSALVSLSKHIEYDELEQKQSLVRKYNCSVGTASTQASSTRMMLRALGICEVTKNKNGDVIRTIAGNARCDQMLALFATKPAD